LIDVDILHHSYIGIPDRYTDENRCNNELFWKNDKTSPFIELNRYSAYDDGHIFSKDLL